MRPNRKSILVTLGATTVLMTATAAMAAPQYGSQQNASQQGGVSMANQGGKVSAQSLAKFKKAFHNVLAISHKYSPKIRKTHNARKAQALQRKARTQMVQAVKNSGLSVRKYNDIVAKMQRDPTLRKQVMSGTAG